MLFAISEHRISNIALPGVGIITFPSYHSTMAVLLIYACLPLAFLRLIIIPINLIMFFAIPIYGDHYLVDVIAGILIALLGIMIAHRLLPERLHAAPP
jgi:hypothetical protein